MDLLRIVLYEVWYYGPLVWLGFIAVAYCAPRYLGCFGILLSVFLVGFTLLVLDVNWIFDDMRRHTENGRDADFVFMFGVICRFVLFNLLLVPASVLGLRLFARRRRASSNVPSV